MKTFTVRKGGGTDYAPGWHTNTISKASYGEYGDNKYIDVWFDGYNDNFKLRVYEKMNKEGEEFAISNLFRFANAGITDALDSGDKNMVVKFDDDANGLVGKTIHVYYYKDKKGYTAVLNQVAPTPFTNVADTFTDKDTVYYKNKAESYYQRFILPRIHKATEGSAVNSMNTTGDIPF